jgi:serine/threonine protein kinase
MSENVLELLKEIEEIRIDPAYENLNESLRALVTQDQRLAAIIDKAKITGTLPHNATLEDLERAKEIVQKKISRIVGAMGEASGNPRAGRELERRKSAGPPEIPPEEIIFDPIKDYLGGGAYGKVYRGFCRGKNVAVKIPSKQNMTESELQSFRHEVEIMRHIFHPNVVLFLGACTQPNKIMIVTELMKTDLERLIHHNPEVSKITLYQRLKMAKDAALGMNWLHGICRIIHRDLKCANLLVDNNMTVKVTDFGFAENLKVDRYLLDKKGPKGTALYMAPEVMRQEEFNEKADVYSFGLILYELISGEELFPQYEELDPFFQAICIDHERPIPPPHTPPSVAALMKRCWSADPIYRPSFEEIIRSLDEILIEVAIQDPIARNFWRNNFYSPKKGLQEEVPWGEFVNKLSQSADIDITRETQHKLCALIATNSTNSQTDNTPVVTMDRLQLLTSWFGPFFLPSHITTLQEMAKLQQLEWFHGNISKDVAERRLRARIDNTFLVRLSLNDPAATPFTISRIRNNKPTHKRVTRLPDGKLSVPVENYTLECSTLVGMVEKLKAKQNLGADCPHNEIINPYVVND